MPQKNINQGQFNNYLALLDFIRDVSTMNYSNFGDRFSRFSGITQLMGDLNEGLLRDDMVMLGGGNPASIPQVQDVIQQILQQQMNSGEFMSAIANYDGPQGKDSFLDALVDYFQQKYGWAITRNNIALTQGSQNSFFGLFNMFSGKNSKGIDKKVLLPLTPEYIGYSDVGITDHQLLGHPALIEEKEDGFFKYHVDFKTLPIDDRIGLMTVSRPTNPTGNVLTDDEIKHLDRLAQEKQIPLLIDNAYGTPFPNIVFSNIQPFWNSNTIVCMSLSKLGLPGIRTGIVIAHEDIVKTLSNITANHSLSPVGVGASIVQQMIKTDVIDDLCEQTIKPYYQNKINFIVHLLKQSINDSRFSIHQPEGAIFVWLRFKSLGITTKELYQRLKQKGLLVVPGEYFYPGRNDEDEHQHECIRMNIVQSEADIKKGIAILKTELDQLWQ